MGSRLMRGAPALPFPPCGGRWPGEAGRMRGRAARRVVTGVRDETGADARDPSSVVPSGRHLLPQGEKGGAPVELVSR